MIDMLANTAAHADGHDALDVPSHVIQGFDFQHVEQTCISHGSVPRRDEFCTER